MPVNSFPMRRIGDRESFAPHLFCHFSNPDRPDIPPIPAFALIDTGSTACSVSVDLAQALGHNIDRVESREIDTAGDPVRSWRHAFAIKVFHMQVSNDDRLFVDRDRVVIDLPFIALDVLDSDTDPLFGVRGFLENYTLIADFQKRIFSLKDYRPTRGIRGV
jgi:hypothetical protein